MSRTQEFNHRKKQQQREQDKLAESARVEARRLQQNAAAAARRAALKACDSTSESSRESISVCPGLEMYSSDDSNKSSPITSIRKGQSLSNTASGKINLHRPYVMRTLVGVCAHNLSQFVVFVTADTKRKRPRALRTSSPDDSDAALRSIRSILQVLSGRTTHVRSCAGKKLSGAVSSSNHKTTNYQHEHADFEIDKHAYVICPIALGPVVTGWDRNDEEQLVTDLDDNEFVVIMMHCRK